MIDKTYLKPGYSSNKADGYYADFYDNGKLKEFAYYKNGSADDWWVLTLEEKEDKGKVLMKNGSGGTADWETNNNGTVVVFDAWSDNSKPQKIPFETWVKKWIEIIYEHKNDQK